MKNKGLIITLITFLSVIAIALIIFMIFLLNGKIRFSYFALSYKVSEELVLDEVYEEDFEKLVVTADTSDIEIKVSSDDKVRVVIYGEKEDIKVDTSNQELSIVSKGKKCIGFCWNMKLDKIEVYLPDSFEYFIEIKNNYGDIKIEKFLNANIKVEEDCGDVSILGGNQVTVNNDYGDIKVEEANTVIVDESCGDVIIGTVSNATIENNYGDIEVAKVLNYLDIEQDCGDVKVDSVSLQQNSRISNSLGTIKIGSTNEIYIDAKTDLGDVKINHNYPKSDITLKLDNSCGDIKVNN